MSDKYILNNHPNTKEIILCDGEYVYKRAIGEFSKKVFEEASFYRALENLPWYLKKDFPNFYGYDNTGKANYIKLEFLKNHTNLSELLDLDKPFDFKVVTEKIIQIIIKWQNFRFKGDNEKCFNELYDCRLESRLKELREESRDLWQLYSKQLVINGKKNESLKNLVSDLIESTFYKDSKKSESLTFFHGDLHFENILIDRNLDIKLVDPKGKLNGLISYDLGKLLHSSFGKYNVIQNYKYKLKRERKWQYIFLLDESTNYLKFSNNLESSLKDNFSGLFYKMGLMACFIHMVTLIPHHLKNKNHQAEALLLQAVIIGERVKKIINLKI